jgi:hypothetical protein
MEYDGTPRGSISYFYLQEIDRVSRTESGP